MNCLLTDEIKSVDLGDVRLNARFAIILDSLMVSPNSSIPKSCCSKSKTKATYRFLDNNRVSAKKIREGFFNATAKRVKNESEVLIISDSTNLVYSSHKSLKGAGVLRNFKARGFALHTTLVATSEGEPLGSFFQAFWGRDPKGYGKRKSRKKIAFENKESYRWLESIQSAENFLDSNTRAIFIADRGADIYELFAYKRVPNFELLIRACHNRKIPGMDNPLFDQLEEAAILGYVEVEVGRAPNRSPRKAKLEIRSMTTAIGKNNNQKIAINVVLAKEVSIPADDSQVIVWRLLTTLPVSTLEQAYDCVKKYSKRWLIERYHYVLKSGCQVEELQLEEADRVERAIAMYSIIAYKLLFITYFARTSPEMSALKVFKKDELKALYLFSYQNKKFPDIPITIFEAVNLVAKLGGFLGRKSDGFPGVKVIWLGLKSLADITASFRLWGKRCG